MTRYLIVRHGANASNQHMCARLAVAIVEAADRRAAIEKAHQRITCYVNQTLEAIPESRARVSEWNEVIEEDARIAYEDDGVIW